MSISARAQQSDAGLGVAVEGDATRPSKPSSKWQLSVFLASVAACAVGYVGYIIAYGVNVVFWDSWRYEAFLLPGQPTLGSLWQQHNEDIFFFPNLIAIAVIHLTNWNDIALMLVSAVFMCGVLAVVTSTFWGDIKRAPLLWLPVPFVVLTLAQYQNTLWSFQVAWPLSLLCLLASVSLLCRPVPSTKRLVGAAVLGIVASYSLLQGLLVWPVGLIVLLAKGQRRRTQIIWCALGAVVTVGYFHAFSFEASGSEPLSYVFGHLHEAFVGGLIAAGSAVPTIDSGIAHVTSLRLAELLGALLLAMGGIVIATWFATGREGGSKAFCVALVIMSILFDVMLVPGRLVVSPTAGTTSRYDTFTWPLLLGIYGYTVIWIAGVERRKVGVRLGQAAVSVVVVAEIVVATIVGTQQGQVTQTVRRTAVDVLANWQTAPVELAAPYLLPPCATTPSFCTDLVAAAQVLQQRHMNIFDDPGQVQRLQTLGIVPGGEPTSLLPIPAALQSQVKASAVNQRAWSTLSAVYWSESALQAQYAPTDRGMTQILRWAIASGDEVTKQAIINAQWYPPVSGAYFLKQYGSIYRSWVLSGKT
jgi:hypothetical protein